MHLEVDIGQSDDNTKSKLIVINTVLIIVFTPEKFFIKEFDNLENTVVLDKYDRTQNAIIPIHNF